MKRCPTCQQTFPDNLEVCSYDGSQLMADASQQYAPGGQPPPGAYYPPPGQYPPPGYPPGSYPPYGYAQPGGGGLGKAALFTGIGATGCFALGFILVAIAINNFDRNMAGIGGIFILLSGIAGLAAIVLSIVTLAMAGKNPALNKAHGIIGLILGIVPIIFWIIGIANYPGSRYRY